MGWLNSRRVRTYPRTILIVIWTAIGLNWAFSHGWRGWGGQVLFIDFIVFYSDGLLFRESPSMLYDFGAQLSLQRSLIAPTPLEGTGPFSHPPYVAPFLGLLSYMPLPVALGIWTALSAGALVMSILLMRRLFSQQLAGLGIPMSTLIEIVLSSACIVLGLYSGQIHTFVLLGAIGVVTLILDQRLWSAGVIAGLLAIKPQLALGFGLLFLAAGHIRACIAAVLAFGALNAVLIATVGWNTAVLLYSDYLRTTQSLLFLPFQGGFPAYLQMTPYSLLTGLTQIDHQRAVFLISILLATTVTAWFLYDAWRLRHAGEAGIRLPLGRALLLPFLLTPYWMMYDGGLLLLAWPLIAMSGTQATLLAGGALIYGWFWIFPVLSAVVGVPLGTVAPVGLWVYSVRQYQSITSTSLA